MELKPLKVSEVNQYIKRLLSSDPILYNIKVEGEISNLKHHYSGHMYFTLKDGNGRLKCVMFEGDSRDLALRLEDGVSIIATGFISVYEKDGTYQLYVKGIKAKGLGDLYIAFEELKRKLEKENLFNPVNKKKIPYMPKKIGIVTSSTGAAIKDMITVLKRRFPPIEIVVYPVLVQGDRAHMEICEGLRYFNSRDDIDLVITGRGGGSLEELWAFNEEDVARTIYSMDIPVISAVGHETDFTIADFVADLRAPTPSAASELAVPLLEDVRYKLDNSLYRMERGIKKVLKEKRNHIEKLKGNILYRSPNNSIIQYRQTLDSQFREMFMRITHKKESIHKDLRELKSRLEALSPMSTLERGYTIAINNKGNIIKSPKELEKGDTFSVVFNDGRVKTMVIDKE